MTIRPLIIFLLLQLPFFSFAQNLTGIWKGYFSSGFGSDKKYYSYELQIEEMSNGHISGVSYSYLNNDFYGKTAVSGSFNDKTGKLDIRENKLLEVKAVDKNSVLLMSLDMNYSKLSGKRTLSGFYSSFRSNSNQINDQGAIELSSSDKSDFSREAFLQKKKHNSNLVVTKYKKKTKTSTTHTATLSTVSGTSVSEKSSVENKNEQVINTQSLVAVDKMPVPFVIKNRTNKLIQTIVTHTKDVDVDFFDNGEIDGDSISLYLNNRQVIKSGRLTRNAINFKTEIEDNQPNLDFILVAENLGRIPPNSALMVIYTNHKRYEIFIESDLKTNGQVRIIYEPPTTK
ncbi:hypothetical protein [Rhizosphaericola mali]|uniref:Uncharacterized protein n=1 Tax=Rhizosphaericola mali TaxID=2545455 RepID=A0A5P2G679_9BACT|nr:hypothetical protein [Rhizosphaericola mali]QES89739.1 hypothetical protein E0W69_014070 [Rhizosphaericola mali]